MRKISNCLFDCLAISIGITALILLLACPESKYLDGLTIAGALFCAVYIVRALELLIRMPRFDWHLFHGSFLFKVICLALLIPCLLTSVIKCDKLSRKASVKCPKEFVYEDGLYQSGIERCKHSLKEKQTDPPLLWSVYYHFIDPGNQHMTATKNGRGWAGLIAILGVFLLNGLLVSSIIGWVDHRKERWLKGEIRYKWFLKIISHYIVIGGNDLAVSIVKQIFKMIEEDKSLFKPYILIQTSRDVESFRRELFSALTERQQQRVIIYYGNRNSKKDIKELNLCNSKEVYILGEDIRTDDIESYHDTMNMKCLDLMLETYKNSRKGKEITKILPVVQEYRNQLEKCNDSEEDSLRSIQSNRELDARWGNRPRLNCRVMFEYQTTFSVFQFFDLNELMDTYINFIPFNYYELWAKNVLINKCLEKQQLEYNFRKGRYLPLEGSDGIKIDDEKYVHLFVVGMSRMGVALAIEAAHLAHYPNYEKKKIRTKITFIDKNAAEEKDFFMGRFKELFSLSHWRYGDVCDNNSRVKWHKTHIPSGYKYLGGDFIDIEWEFINGGIESSTIQNYILASAIPTAKITIAICLPESNRSHAAALFLDKRIYASNSVLQVLAYNRYGSSIVNAIGKSGSEYPFCGKLRSFGCVEDCVVRKHLALSEEIGKYIADAYAKGKPQYAINPENSYSGKSNTANRWSSIYNGNTLWTKLRCIDFNSKTFVEEQKNIDILSDVEHNRWNVEELLMNFRYLEKEEQREVINGKKKKKGLKKKMAHLDICSNDRLMKVDGAARQNDVLLTEYLENIYDYLKNKRDNPDD